MQRGMGVLGAATERCGLKTEAQKARTAGSDPECHALSETRLCAQLRLSFQRVVHTLDLA
eukprot:11632885-Alexandrium_andersonii.AAC.1